MKRTFLSDMAIWYTCKLFLIWTIFLPFIFWLIFWYTLGGKLSIPTIICNCNSSIVVHVRKYINKPFWLPNKGFWMRIWENWQLKRLSWQPIWFSLCICWPRVAKKWAAMDKNFLVIITSLCTCISFTNNLLLGANLLQGLHAYVNVNQFGSWNFVVSWVYQKVKRVKVFYL